MGSVVYPLSLEARGDDDATRMRMAGFAYMVEVQRVIDSFVRTFIAIIIHLELVYPLQMDGFISDNVLHVWSGIQLLSRQLSSPALRGESDGSLKTLLSWGNLANKPQLLLLFARPFDNSLLLK